MKLKEAYYIFKNIIPRLLQIQVRRTIINRQRLIYKDIWPIDKNSSKAPDQWSGWPNEKKFALVLTHDIESAKALDKCQILAEIDEHYGFRSAFNFVAKDCQASTTLRRYLIEHGFEIGLHGLNHDQNPFRSKSVFQQQSDEINRYLEEWQSVGFRSPSMYHDLELLHHINIEYDASTFDTDPFEPQPDGMGTIFPFWVSGNSRQRGYVELPYTLPQDFLLFILMQENNIDIWKEKLDWIVANGGMALFITHPNYMNFDRNQNFEEYPARHYVEFLAYIKSKYKDQYWHVLPREMARWWADRFKK